MSKYIFCFGKGFTCMEGHKLDTRINLSQLAIL